MRAILYRETGMTIFERKGGPPAVIRMCAQKVHTAVTGPAAPEKIGTYVAVALVAATSFALLQCVVISAGSHVPCRASSCVGFDYPLDCPFVW